MTAVRAFLAFALLVGLYLIVTGMTVACLIVVAVPLVWRAELHRLFPPLGALFMAGAALPAPLALPPLAVGLTPTVRKLPDPPGDAGGLAPDRAAEPGGP